MEPITPAALRNMKPNFQVVSHLVKSPIEPAYLGMATIRFDDGAVIETLSLDDFGEVFTSSSQEEVKVQLVYTVNDLIYRHLSPESFN